MRLHLWAGPPSGLSGLSEEQCSRAGGNKLKVREASTATHAPILSGDGNFAIGDK
eukprot:CAMPEP_0170416308 /NCGR_PEP_ID=MMETSP0117_2-20130122/33087_1 /TAXON_ID=400756 /ORGANISM="Durinskia baltica, Strain CSIRO CS-38" /LENGTH=54 /DNA_ID=CAMNT_0010674365 /DNA_START=160 /DNA_END=321 /DNA_ORIENTATION=-